MFSKKISLCQTGVSILVNQLLLTVFSCVLVSSTFAAEYTISEINRIERKALDSRKKIKSWHVRISIEKELINLPEFDPKDKRGTLVGMELYYNGELFRMERVFLDNSKERRHFSVLGNEWCYRFGTDVLRREGSDEDIPVLYMDSVEKEKKVFPLFDIRTLGFVPSLFQYNTENLDTYIGNPSRSNIFMCDDTLDGVLCYKVSFLHPHIYTEHKVYVWLSPKHDFNPLKFEFDFPEIKQKSTYLMELKQDVSSGIWFPSAIHTTVLRDNEIAYENKALIEVVSFNKKLDSLLFTEKKLGLPIGTLALIDPEPAPGTYIWNGERIVDLREATLSESVTSTSNVFNLLMALGLALICAGCLVRYFKLSKKK